MMTLEEAIEHCKDVALSCTNKECALEHFQLSKWLQEYSNILKIYKLLPELKESEGEKLRKEMLQLAKESEDSFYIVLTPNKRKTLINWLEKQGESDETKAKEFLINKGYPIDTNDVLPTYEEMYNIIRDGLIVREGLEKARGAEI